jgi:hypothetical protein
MEFLSPVNHIFPDFYAKKALDGSKIDFQGINYAFFTDFAKLQSPLLSE